MQNTDLTRKVEHYQSQNFIITYKNGQRNFYVWGY